jgi:hypothetical protein
MCHHLLEPSIALKPCCASPSDAALAMSGWYNKSHGNQSWNPWRKGGWRPKGQGKGSQSSTPISDVVTSLQTTMKEQQLMQALVPALLGPTNPSAAPTPIAPVSQHNSATTMPDELTKVLSGLKDSIESIAKAQMRHLPVCTLSPTHQCQHPVNIQDWT